MIYTVTLNPAIDYIVNVEHFKLGITNRTKDELILPGGKGINVSKVLANFDVDSVALGFRAGHVGSMLHEVMEREGIIDDFTEIPGETRINLKIRNIEGTEINGCGPTVGEAELTALRNRIYRLSLGDVLYMGGRIPNGASTDIYADIMEKTRKVGLHVVLDTSGESLVKALKYEPFLIKPNRYEAGEIFGDTLSGFGDAVECTKKLRSMGARNVIVSLDSQGAVMEDEFSNIYIMKSPEGKCVNAVGAGDAMVAGFLAGYIGYGMTVQESFEFGVCAASASTFTMKYATKRDVFDIYRKNRYQQR